MRLLLARSIILIAFFGLWEFASGRWVAPIFISRPTLVFQTFGEWVMDGTLFFHAAITATEAFVGFFVGSVAGVVAGLVLGRCVRVAEVVEPFIRGFYSLPKLALAPLFILWFGIGMNMKVAFTATIVFFLVFLNTYTGVRNVSRELITILKLMGATEQYLLRRVVIPSAITWMFAGLRISAPYALVGAVVAELVAANRGLGYLLASSAGQFDTAGVFAALVGIVLLAALLNFAVGLIEAKSMPWRKSGEMSGLAI